MTPPTPSKEVYNDFNCGLGLGSLTEDTGSACEPRQDSSVQSPPLLCSASKLQTDYLSTHFGGRKRPPSSHIISLKAASLQLLQGVKWMLLCQNSHVGHMTRVFLQRSGAL